MTQYKLEGNVSIHTDITRLQQGHVGGQVDFE